MKICIAASGGGHLTDLHRFSKAYESFNAFLLTTDDIIINSPVNYKKIYITKKANRKQPFRLVIMFVYCVKIILRENPDVIISSGAAVGCIICLLGKLIGKRVVWIECFA